MISEHHLSKKTSYQRITESQQKDMGETTAKVRQSMRHQ